MRAGLLRFLLILSASALCIWIFYISVVEIRYIYFGSEEDNESALYVAILGTIFLLFSHYPYYLAAILTLSAIHIAMDRFGAHRLWVYILLWVICGAIVSSNSRIEFMGALPVATLASAIYWVLAGRVAGKAVSP